ncbi:hypothetical protein TcCL_NonESM06456 [Trypanosoma cruzi]|nr:hypothetical protein TcCL_NonESM06456 [Trypanosoma cruzi]
MGVGRQSTVSDQLLLIGLRQLVAAARSHKQQEKTQTHWPGHRRIPRQVPHAIQVFPEGFVPNGDVFFHLPHLRQSLLPVLCHKPRANIDVQRQSGLPLLKLRRSPHRTAQLRKIGLRLHALQQSRVIRVESFQRRRKLLLTLRKKTMTVRAPVHIFLTKYCRFWSSPRRFLQVCSYNFFSSGIRSSSRHRHLRWCISGITMAQPQSTMIRTGLPRLSAPLSEIRLVVVLPGKPSKKVLASPWQMLPLFWWRMTGTPLFMA